MSKMAERKGFEPSVACATHAFQACAFDHSATSLYFECQFYPDSKQNPTIRNATLMGNMAGGQGFEPWEV